MSRTSSRKQRCKKATFEVAHNAVYGVNAPNTSFTVNPGAILQGGVAGTVAANQFTLQSGATFNIAGNAPPAQGFSVFTIDAAQASFESGSRLLFNTELNDASVQHTDLLVLSHAITDAPGGIVVTNFGGTGGETGAPRRHPTGRGDQRRHDNAQQFHSFEWRIAGRGVHLRSVPGRS